MKKSCYIFEVYNIKNINKVIIHIVDMPNTKETFLDVLLLKESCICFSFITQYTSFVTISVFCSYYILNRINVSNYEWYIILFFVQGFLVVLRVKKNFCFKSFNVQHFDNYTKSEVKIISKKGLVKRGGNNNNPKSQSVEYWLVQSENLQLFWP